MIKSKRTSPISIIIVTYNSSDYIKRCLTVLLKSISEIDQVIVVDNNSSDGTLIILSEFDKKIELIINDKNSGYAGGNNLGIEYAKNDYVLFVNPDVEVTEGFLEELLSCIDDQNVAAVQPLVLISGSEKTINLTGKSLHFTGLEWCTNCLLNYKPDDLSKSYIDAVSGSCFLIKKDLYISSGGFDNEYFMYGEDSDLSWRLRALDYKLIFCPSSIVYHDYKFLVDKKNLSLKLKFYYVERNRLINVLTNYQFSTLILLFPAMVITEFGLCLYATINGLLLSKIKGYLFILSNVKFLYQRRLRFNDLRVLGDRKLLENVKSSVDFGMFGGNGIRFFNVFWGLYWKAVKSFI